MTMARTQTIVQLSDELVGELDAIARRRNISRSALIRDLLEQGLAEDHERTIGEQIAEGYRRIPQGTPDVWGNLEAETEALGDEAMADLAAEERAAGHDPW